MNVDLFIKVLRIILIEVIPLIIDAYFHPRGNIHYRIPPPKSSSFRGNLGGRPRNFKK